MQEKSQNCFLGIECMLNRFVGERQYFLQKKDRM